MALTHERIDEIAAEAGYDVRPYSGRAMYGRECPSITSDDPLLKTVAKLVECCNDTDEAAELIRTMREDNMGLGVVLYWPRVKLIDDAT